MVNLIYLTSASSHSTVSYPRTLIIVGKGAQVKVIESYIGADGGESGPEYFTNAVTEIDLEEAASLDHYRLIAESDHAFHVGTSRVSLGQDSVLSSTSLLPARSLPGTILKSI